MTILEICVNSITLHFFFAMRVVTARDVFAIGLRAGVFAHRMGTVCLRVVLRGGWVGIFLEQAHFPLQPGRNQAALNEIAADPLKALFAVWIAQIRKVSAIFTGRDIAGN